MWHSFLFSILKRTIMKRKTRFNFLKKKGYVLVTLTLFVISIALHWIFGWEVFKQEQLEHGQSIIISDYVMEMLRDTMENWQSEFLQLIWQVAGLAFLWYVGSPQSKEGDDRKEEKLDYIIRKMDPEIMNV
jgi:SNF family Na+-dependent transporter